MYVLLENFVSVYLWSVSILLSVSLVCLLYSKTLPKQNILNFTMTVFVKILDVQEAWSHGVIWLNTVAFLWILVNKHSVNCFQQRKYTADFSMLLIYKEISCS